MGGLGWAELLVIGIVALVVIGPKDLPEMFRQIGRVTAKARAMASEFSRAMEQAGKESGAADALKTVKTMTSAKSMGMDKVRAAADSFEKWDPMQASKTGAAPNAGGQKPLVPPPMPPKVEPTKVEQPQIEPPKVEPPIGTQTSDLAQTPISASAVPDLVDTAKKPAAKRRAPRKTPPPSPTPKADT